MTASVFSARVTSVWRLQDEFAAAVYSELIIVEKRLRARIIGIQPCVPPGGGTAYQLK
jgi:hypothetical protein